MTNWPSKPRKRVNLKRPRISLCASSGTGRSPKQKPESEREKRTPQRTLERTKDKRGVLSKKVSFDGECRWQRPGAEYVDDDEPDAALFAEPGGRERPEFPFADGRVGLLMFGLGSIAEVEIARRPVT
jgi:hypothetical protein